MYIYVRRIIYIIILYIEKYTCEAGIKDERRNEGPAKAQKPKKEGAKSIMIFHLDILGDDWTVRIIPTEEDERLKDCDGFTDITSRTITVDSMDTVKRFELDDKSAYVKHAIRHEVVHAFFFASGLGFNFEHKDIGHEETVVDWIACQFHKLRRTIEQAERFYEDASAENHPPAQNEGRPDVPPVSL